MIKSLVNLLPANLKKNVYSFVEKRVYKYGRTSYAQEGEDLILSRFFGNKRKGLYVDVGAHHPFRYSNTYFFYRKGWRGINIDAMPGSMDAFKAHRPKDINLEIGISGAPGTLTYYIFDEPAINSFDKELSEQRIKEGVYHLRRKVDVQTKTLGNILHENLKSTDKIDFLSIDVEGLDHIVLMSNDWENFRPEFILVELYNFSIVSLKDNPTYKLLKEYGYEFAAKAFHTVIFRRAGS